MFGASVIIHIHIYVDLYKLRNPTTCQQGSYKLSLTNTFPYVEMNNSPPYIVYVSYHQLHNATICQQVKLSYHS